MTDRQAKRRWMRGSTFRRMRRRRGLEIELAWALKGFQDALDAGNDSLEECFENRYLRVYDELDRLKV